MADDDIAVDDVVEEFRQMGLLARLHVSGKAADLEILLHALPSLAFPRESDKLRVGEGKELHGDVTPRELACPLALQQGGVGAGHADAEPLVELLENIELPSVQLVDLVKVEPPSLRSSALRCLSATACRSSMVIIFGSNLLIANSQHC